MKKLLTLVAIVGTFTFVSCGPSAEQTAADKAKADSTANFAKADSIAKAAATADSALVKADSVKK